jgi:hypothetical protein
MSSASVTSEAQVTADADDGNVAEVKVEPQAVKADGQHSRK